MWYPLFNVYGCSKKLLLSTGRRLSGVVINAGQMMRS